MATEQQYDDIIAPMLQEVAERCEELGMALVARVEWAPGESGITRVVGKDQSVQQWLAYYAAHARGNLDQLAMTMCNKFDRGSSIVCHLMKPQKTKP